MADSYVQIQPDGAGKQIDTQAVLTPTGQVVHRQTVTIGDGLDIGDVAQVNAGALNVNDATGVLPGSLSVDAPLCVSVTGNANGDFAGVNLLEEVVRDGSGLAVNVKSLNAPAVDANNAMLIADGKVIQTPWLPVNASLIIDTTGYQTLNITTQTLVANILGSNDGVTYSAITGSPVVYGASVTAVSAAASFTFPCLTRFIKITATTAGTATCCLRAQVYDQNYTTSPTSVGGNVAVGITPTANPVLVGGVDNAVTPLVRRLQTDANGNQFAVGPLPVGSQIGSYNSAIITQAQSTVHPVIVGGADQGNIVRRQLVDPSGRNIVEHAASTQATVGVAELLTQILAVLRVQNLYLYQLATGQTVGASDEPEILAADFLNPAEDGSMPHLKN